VKACGKQAEHSIIAPAKRLVGFIDAEEGANVLLKDSDRSESLWKSTG
jgi:hypothetical protein